MTTTDQSASSGYSGLTDALAGMGDSLGAAGVALQVVGAFYGILATKDAREAQALALQHQQTLANLNARAAEMDAQFARKESQRQAGRSDLQYRAVASAARTRQAAAGIQRGVGSAAEVQASIELSRQADRVSITTSGIRAANAYRMQAVNARGQAGMAGLSAANLRLGNASISPWVQAAGSLLQGAGNYGQSRARTRRDERRFGEDR